MEEELNEIIEMSPSKQPIMKIQTRFDVLDEESLDGASKNLPLSQRKPIQTKKGPLPIVMVSKFGNLRQLHQEVKKIVGDK